MNGLPVSLKRQADPRLREYLTEHDFEPQFSVAKKLYYWCARPLLPVRVRQWLQRRYARGITCAPSFVWGDLVELLKSDEEGWDRFTGSLYPDGHKCAIVITHDVETQEGLDFIPDVIALEQKYGIRGSWNVVPYLYELRSEIMELIVNSGHEIGIHGYNHDGTLYYSRQRFSRRAAHINRALERHGAVGFRSPQVHRNLLWLQDLRILYDASCFDYDPYQPFPGGTGCIWPFMAGKFVELPYTVPQDHVLFYTLGLRDISIWKEKVKWLVDNHGMILTLTHPDYLKEKDHLRHYEEFLNVLVTIPDAWHSLPREMATWYKGLSEA